MDSHTFDFTLLDHTADLGIIVRGPDPKELFQNAARAMIQLMVEGTTGSGAERRTFAVTGEDMADLMVRWLGEILYLFEGEKEIVVTTEIDALSPSRLETTIETVPFDPTLHEVLREIKAVTYHQIDVARRGDHWEARIIFDL